MTKFSKFLSLDVADSMGDFVEKLQREIRGIMPHHFTFKEQPRDRLHCSVALYEEQVCENEGYHDIYRTLDDKIAFNEGGSALYTLRNGPSILRRQAPTFYLDSCCHVPDCRGIILTPNLLDSNKRLTDLIEASLSRVARSMSYSQDFSIDVVGIEVFNKRLDKEGPKDLVLRVESNYLTRLREDLDKLFTARSDLWKRHNLKVNEWGLPVKLHVTIGSLSCSCKQLSMHTSHDSGIGIQKEYLDSHCGKVLHYLDDPCPFPYTDLEPLLNVGFGRQKWRLPLEGDHHGFAMDIMRLGPISPIWDPATEQEVKPARRVVRYITMKGSVVPKTWSGELLTILGEAKPQDFVKPCPRLSDGDKLVVDPTMKVSCQQMYCSCN